MAVAQKQRLEKILAHVSSGAAPSSVSTMPTSSAAPAVRATYGAPAVDAVRRVRVHCRFAGLYINGEEVAALDGSTFQVRFAQLNCFHSPPCNSRHANTIKAPTKGAARHHGRQVIAPATAEVIYTAAEAKAGDVDAAVAAAKARRTFGTFRARLRVLCAVHARHCRACFDLHAARFMRVRCTLHAGMLRELCTVIVV